MRRPVFAALERPDVAMLSEVRAGLSARQKKLPPKYFYDRRGAELFERITELPEYYLTRAERAILTEWAPELAAALRPRSLVELGAGSATKSRVLLDAMQTAGGAGLGAEVYVPLDVSVLQLAETARRLRVEYPGLDVQPMATDISADFVMPRRLPRPALFAFLGSTIGNFHYAPAVRLLRRVFAAMDPGDRFLLGVDLRKERGVLVEAYNDAAGLTAEFNRNMLQVLNHQLGADFDPGSFEHRAFYNQTAHRIEMHLVSRRDQAVTIPGIGVVHFAEGETIRTEISCKYDRQSVTDLLADAGLRLEEWRTDPDGLFALALAAPQL